MLHDFSHLVLDAEHTSLTMVGLAVDLQHKQA